MSKNKHVSESPKLPKDKVERDNLNGLPGWPGYRTRDGRSGYDPIDTRTEAAHTFGTFLRHLLSGRLRIRNPIYIALSGLSGLLLSAPLILAMSELTKENSFDWNAWIFFLISGTLGLVVLINSIKNLIKFIYKR